MSAGGQECQAERERWKDELGRCHAGFLDGGAEYV
jgi:hypothetical protein